MMERYLEYLNFELLGNSGKAYATALGIFIGLLIIFKIFKTVILSRISGWVKKTKTDIDDELIRMINNIPGVFYTVVALYAALQFIDVADIVYRIADVALIILVIFWATKAASDLIEFILYKLAKRKDGKATKEKTSAYFAFSLIIKITLWSIGLLLALSNLGVNISALVASLGIGGIAIALAVQNILGDLFSSFSIYIDKPFEIGDFIIVGDQMGTVKKIGLKTTRITALQGEEIVFSNRELTTGQIRNYKKMKKRRIVFGFGVTYDTPTKKLRHIPKMVKEVIGKMKKTDFDRAHFKEFGDFSLNYEVVYFINSGDYNDYMDAQQKINLAIMDAFAKEEIEMAFPTQTIHVNSS